MKIFNTYAVENGYDDGNIIILTVMTLMIMFAFAGLAFDVGNAYAKHCDMSNVASIARDANLDTAILVRNSQNPADAVADNMLHVIRANGYTGEVYISFYELSPMEMGYGNNQPYSSSNTDGYDFKQRIWVVDITLKDSSPCFFMSMFGYASLNVTAETVTSNENKTSTKVWIPDNHMLSLSPSNAYNATYFADGDQTAFQPANITPLGWCQFDHGATSSHPLFSDKMCAEILSHKS